MILIPFRIISCNLYCIIRHISHIPTSVGLCSCITLLTEEIESETESVQTRLPEYRSRPYPIMTAGSYEPGSLVISLAIDRQTDYIYISDFGNERISVYDNSLQFLFSFDTFRGVPLGICVHLDSVCYTR